MRKAGIAMLLTVGVAGAADVATYGFQVPVTASGGGMFTRRLENSRPGASPLSGGFQATAYPTVRLGRHFFAYGAVQVRLAPYFYYDAYEGEREWYGHLIQAYLGYSTQLGPVSITAKAGKLASAFGAFPPRYDDAQNALLDQPLSYVMRLRLRPDQLPCSVSDLLHQGEYYNYVEHYCGGSTREHRPGMTPVTLYGLPGAEIDVTMGGADARLQLTNSSPANPQGLRSGAQYLQWTAGGGYTIKHRFRAGFSAFSGPYLEAPLREVLPAGKTLRSYLAKGHGLDFQWSHGRFSANGEWQHFRFQSPRLPQSPSASSAYFEVKAILTPRLYIASRVGQQRYGSIRDRSGVTAESFAPAQGVYEAAIGIRPNRVQLIKVGYEWMRTSGVRGKSDNVFGVQWVVSIHSISGAFR